MPDATICRSSAGCAQKATAGTFGTYFCAEHFAEIDLIRRTWFSADGTPNKTPRDPSTAAPSISELAERVREIVAEHAPRPVRRSEIRAALGLPHAQVVQVCHVAANMRKIRSATHGYVLVGRRSVEQRARDIAEVVQSAEEDYVTLARVCAATGMAATSSSGPRAIRQAVANGWVIDNRRARAGGFEAGPVKLPAAA